MDDPSPSAAAGTQSELGMGVTKKVESGNWEMDLELGVMRAGLGNSCRCLPVLANALYVHLCRHTTNPAAAAGALS
jgi:hypothetical protein